MANLISSHVDYVSTYFKYPIATKITGEPSFKTLKQLKRELKANASSVDTNLGGGNHGYLGLVLSDAEYLTVAARLLLHRIIHLL